MGLPKASTLIPQIPGTKPSPQRRLGCLRTGKVLSNFYNIGEGHVSLLKHLKNMFPGKSGLTGDVRRECITDL